MSTIAPAKSSSSQSPSPSPDRTEREKRRNEHRLALENEQKLLVSQLEEKRKSRGRMTSEDLVLSASSSYVADSSLTTPSKISTLPQQTFSPIDFASSVLAELDSKSDASHKFSLDVPATPPTKPSPESLTEGDKIIVESRRRRSLSRERRASAIKTEQAKLMQEYEERKRTRSSSQGRERGLRSSATQEMGISPSGVPTEPSLETRALSQSMPQPSTTVASPGQASSPSRSTEALPSAKSGEPQPDKDGTGSTSSIATSTGSKTQSTDSLGPSSERKTLKSLTSNRVGGHANRRKATQKTLDSMASAPAPVVLSPVVDAPPPSAPDLSSPAPAEPVAKALPKSIIAEAIAQRANTEPVAQSSVSPTQPETKASTPTAVSSVTQRSPRAPMNEVKATPSQAKAASASRPPISPVAIPKPEDKRPPPLETSMSEQSRPITRPMSRSPSFSRSPPSAALTFPILYRLEGKKRMVPLPRQPDASRVSARDSLILVVPKVTIADGASPKGEAQIFVWHGPELPRMRKVKAMEYANRMREQDWQAKAQVMEIDGLPKSAESTEFWQHFKVPQPEKLSYTAQELQENDIEAALELYCYPELDKATIQGKLTRGALSTNQSFILRAKSAMLGNFCYVWTGRSSPHAHDDVAAAAAKQWPDCVTAVPEGEGCEHISFKDLFSDWSATSTSPVRRASVMVGVPTMLPPTQLNSSGGMSRSSSFTQNPGLRATIPAMAGAAVPGGASPRQSFSRAISPTVPEFRAMARMQEIDPAELYQAKAALTGTGKKSYAILKAFVCQERARQQVPKEELGIFYTGDVYVIVAQAAAEGGAVELAKWSGQDSNEGLSAASLVLELEKEHGTTIRCVRQGKEAALFADLFPDGYIIKRGTFGAAPAQHQSRHLFQVHEVYGGTTHVEEVEHSLSSLCSGFSYISACPEDAAFVWHGQYSSPTERAAACQAVKKLSEILKYTQVEDSKEPNEFLNLFTASDGTAVVRSPIFSQKSKSSLRLYQLYPYVKEVVWPTHADLREEGIFLVDLYGAALVWIGQQAKGQTKAITEAYEFATKYAKHVAKTEDGRLDESSVLITYGSQEPSALQCSIPGWKRQPGSSLPEWSKLERVKDLMNKAH
ncbi:hypothetical protein RI367_006009 [Sorochytrium milnesiophthora]